VTTFRFPAQSATWYDDIAVGQHFRSVQPIRLSSHDIIDFARRYDPKPGHFDPQTAEETFFQGLAASGWQTAAVTQRLVTETGFPVDHSVGIGVELTWPTPTRPGDELVVDLEVKSRRLSRSQPDRGIVEIFSQTLNQTGQVRQETRITILLFRDPAVLGQESPIGQTAAQRPAATSSDSESEGCQCPDRI